MPFGLAVRAASMLVTANAPSPSTNTRRERELACKRFRSSTEDGSWEEHIDNNREFRLEPSRHSLARAFSVSTPETTVRASADRVTPSGVSFG